MGNNKRKWVLITITILGLFLIIFVTVVDIDSLLAVLASINPGYFLVGLVFLLIGVVLITIRWRFLLRDEPSFLLTFHADSISYMIKLLTPIPQAVTRTTTLSLTTSIDFYKSAPMMMIERFLDMVMRPVALTLAIVLILEVPLWIAVLIIAVILLLAVPAIVLWFTRNATTLVPRLITRSARIPDLNKEKLQEAMVDFQNNVSTMRATRGFATAVVYSLGMWGLFLLFYASGFQSLGQDLGARQILSMSAVVLAILPPSAPAMIGIYQGAIVAILLPFGYFDVNIATAYALLVFGAQLMVWIILGIWGLKRTELKISNLTQVSMDDDDTVLTM